MKDLENQTKGIREFSKKRTEDAINKVENTIVDLIKSGEQITKYKILKFSGASRKFIYNNQLVDDLIKKYQVTPVVKEIEHTSVKTEMEKLKEEIRTLKEENKTVQTLKKENNRLEKNYNHLKSDYETLERQFSQVCQQKGLI